MPKNAQTQIIARRVPDQPCIQALLVVAAFLVAYNLKAWGQLRNDWSCWSCELQKIPNHFSLQEKNTLAGAFLRWHNDRTTPILAMCGNGSSWGPNFGKKKHWHNMSSRKTIRTIRRSTMPLAGFFCIHMCTNTPSFAEGDVLGGAGIYPAPCWWEWWHNSRDWLAPEVVIFQVSYWKTSTHLFQIFKKNHQLFPWTIKFLLQMFLEQMFRPQTKALRLEFVESPATFDGFWKDSWSQMRMKKWWNHPVFITKKLPFSSNPDLGSLKNQQICINLSWPKTDWEKLEDVSWSWTKVCRCSPLTAAKAFFSCHLVDIGLHFVHTTLRHVWLLINDGEDVDTQETVVPQMAY